MSRRRLALGRQLGRRLRRTFASILRSCGSPRRQPRLRIDRLQAPVHLARDARPPGNRMTEQRKCTCVGPGHFSRARRAGTRSSRAPSTCSASPTARIDATASNIFPLLYIERLFRGRPSFTLIPARAGAPSGRLGRSSGAPGLRN